MNKKGQALIEFAVLVPVIIFIVTGTFTLILHNTKSVLFKKETILTARKALEYEDQDLKSRWVKRHGQYYSTRGRGFWGKFDWRLSNENTIVGSKGNFNKKFTFNTNQ